MKQVKKTLSYLLAVVLALGIGLTYAYAVGANDSNAFVTTTEWEAKFAQLETSLDNVLKTVNDTNMDYVLNGPRLQVNTWEGVENVGYLGQYDIENALVRGDWYRSLSETGQYNYFFSVPHFYLLDTWDGRQAVRNIGWPTGNQTYSMFPARLKYALQTDDPNIYVMIQNYHFRVGQMYGGYFTYFDLRWDGKNPVYYNSAKTVTITLNIDEYHSPGGIITGNIYRTNVDLWTGVSQGYEYENSTRNNADGRESNQNGYMTRTVNANTATITLEYPAGYHTMRLYAETISPFNDLPLDLDGRKYGSLGDYLTTTVPVSKVWSPQKNCICLKNYLNGEIPILNE